MQYNGNIISDIRRDRFLRKYTQNIIYKIYRYFFLFGYRSSATGAAQQKYRKKHSADSIFFNTFYSVPHNAPRNSYCDKFRAKYPAHKYNNLVAFRSKVRSRRRAFPDRPALI